MQSAPGQFEVFGYVLKSYFDAFKLVPHVPRSICAKHGLGRVADDGEYVFELQGTYSMTKAIAALNEIVALVGPKKAFEMGLEIPKNVVVPPGATAIVSAMKVLDGGYHLNHRKNGVAMFDPQRGMMLEGIGHYRCASVADHSIMMDVSVPYPCDFDRGIMQCWAARFERSAVVTHLDPSVCRKTGAPRCRYEITWR